MSYRRRIINDYAPLDPARLHRYQELANDGGVIRELNLKYAPGELADPNPTPLNKALFQPVEDALAERGQYGNIGDTLTTMRDDLPGNYIPMDGRTVGSAQYPSLVGILPWAVYKPWNVSERVPPIVGQSFNCNDCAYNGTYYVMAGRQYNQGVAVIAYSKKPEGPWEYKSVPGYDIADIVVDRTNNRFVCFGRGSDSNGSSLILAFDDPSQTINYTNIIEGGSLGAFRCPVQGDDGWWMFISYYSVYRTRDIYTPSSYTKMSLDSNGTFLRKIPGGYWISGRGDSIYYATSPDGTWSSNRITSGISDARLYNVNTDKDGAYYALMTGSNSNIILYSESISSTQWGRIDTDANLSTAKTIKTRKGRLIATGYGKTAIADRAQGPWITITQQGGYRGISQTESGIVFIGCGDFDRPAVYINENDLRVPLYEGVDKKYIKGATDVPAEGI